MDEFNTKLKEYKEKNCLSEQELSARTHLDLSVINAILNDEECDIEQDDKCRVIELITMEKSKIKGKRVVKILDLVFRLVSMVMALVTLLLCIKEDVDVRVLVILLSIGLVCSSMTILPKIEK